MSEALRKEFNDLIKSLNPDYKKANAEFADAEGIKNAFGTGNTFNLDTTKINIPKAEISND